MWQIRTELSNQLIASGTKEEMELVLSAFGKYGIRQDKFLLVEATV